MRRRVPQQRGLCIQALEGSIAFVDVGRRIGREGLPEHPAAWAQMLGRRCFLRVECREEAVAHFARWEGNSSAASRTTSPCFTPPPRHLHRRRALLLATAGSDPRLQKQWRQRGGQCHEGCGVPSRSRVDTIPADFDVTHVPKCEGSEQASVTQDINRRRQFVPRRVGGDSCWCWCSRQRWSCCTWQVSCIIAQRRHRRIGDPGPLHQVDRGFPVVRELIERHD